MSPETKAKLMVIEGELKTIFDERLEMDFTWNDAYLFRKILDNMNELINS